MHLLRILLTGLLLAWVPLTGTCAESGAHSAGGVEPQAGAHAEHGLPTAPPTIFKIGPLPVTNSMVVTWIVALGLIVFAQLATRKMALVPTGAQNFIEWLVETLYEFLEGVIGHQLVRRTFWFFATIFIFILFSNWLGLLPGFGTIGFGEDSGHGFRVADPWFRGANADMNMTFGMAMVFFACWLVWALQSNGPIGFLMHLFAPPKGEMGGFLKVLMVFVFLAVGILEVVSILFRPVSLSFRLFGNIFAGENMLETMANLVPGWLGRTLVPIPFYFMELLVGIVQALVFMLLTAVFTMLICEHDEGSESKHQ